MGEPPGKICNVFSLQGLSQGFKRIKEVLRENEGLLSKSSDPIGLPDMDFRPDLWEIWRIMNSSARYLRSAWLEKDYPEADRPEVAMVGRSNAGKSSFLNAIFGTKLAKVSQNPGKTRSLNFFDYGDHYRWVDMPGYGFASRGRQEKQDWTKAIETYLKNRSSLVGLVLIMDIRRKWSEDETLLLNWCVEYNKPMVVILNKQDKISKSEAAQAKRKIQTSQDVPVFSVSCSKGTGIEDAEKFVFETWIKNGEDEVQT